MLISFTDPVILKTTPDSKMVNSWHATKMPYYNKNIEDIACQLQAYVCPMLFCFVFSFCSAVFWVRNSEVRYSGSGSVFWVWNSGW